MMKKIAFLAFVPGNEKGIIKKIKYQIKALEKLELNIEKIIILNQLYYFKNKKIGKFYVKKNIIQKIFRKIEEVFYFSKLKDFSLYENIDIIYMRTVGIYPWSKSYFKFLKKINKKIILEIPTYPYDKEKSKFNILNMLDKHQRIKLYKYVDRIVTYSEDKEIWGIPCINISNGIDLSEILLINRKEKKNNKIIFTSVSNCSFWHGIDRFLESLDKYNQQENKKDIIFNIVGEGTESNNIKEIVSKSEYLSKIVKFQGFKTGIELDKIYNETDIGVGSLGRHRSGLHTMRALKNREYCAKGIPMIFSEDDPDLREVSFVYSVTPDEKLIDVEHVIKWYENLQIQSKDIRKYAEGFSWDIQMKKVLDEIEKI